MKCQKCGADNPQYAVYCGMCSSSLRDPQTNDSVPSKHRGFRRTSSLLEYAGILLVVAGLLAFVQAWFFLSSERTTWFTTDISLSFCGSFEILLGLIIIYGGVNTIRRANYSLSLMASVLAIISFGVGASVVLGLITLISVVSSREDFRATTRRSDCQEEGKKDG